MSYQVLARKYRPQVFADVVGQVHVTQTLQNALSQKRIHHAYLFTGARGVGKTTVARLLAKALNCKEDLPKEPCNQCGSCREVMEGRSLDVQEIDGASNTGVDDVRQIREQIKYTPAHGRYKVYIIDEVHMLSTSAFNALLKTLEEPPPHVVFVFATTEPQEIPATILSRCQRYDFRRIPASELVQALRAIAGSEKVEVSGESLLYIAREAAGSLRDGESLLDQAIAFAGSKITFDNLKTMFGLLDREQMEGLLEAIVARDKEGVLNRLQAFYEAGSDLNRLAQDLLFRLRDCYLAASLGKIPEWLEISGDEGERILALSRRLEKNRWDQLVSMALRGVDDVGRSPFPKMVLDILLIRMTEVEDILPIGEILESLERPAASAAPAAGPAVARARPENVPAAPAKEAGWDEFRGWLQKQKPQLASILEHGTLARLDRERVILRFEGDSVYGEMLKEADRQKSLEAFCTQFFGRPLALTLLSEGGGESAREAPSADPNAAKKELQREALRDRAVQEAANIFGARLEDVRVDFKK